MRTGVSFGHRGLRTVIRQRSVTKTITRISSGHDRFGEHAASDSTTHEVDAWIYRPSEVNIELEYGDRLDGDLQGLALDDADLQHDDRLDHGDDSYEIKEIQKLPDEDRAEITIFSLVRRSNPDSDLS